MTGTHNVLVVQTAITKLPQTGWLVNNKHWFLTVLVAGNPRYWLRQIQCQVRNCFFMGSCLLNLTSHGRRDRVHCGVSFTRVLISSKGALISWTNNHLPKAPSKSTITLGIKFSTYKFRWDGGHKDLIHSEQSMNN